jgi:hypothetical protein
LLHQQIGPNAQPLLRNISLTTGSVSDLSHSYRLEQAKKSLSV